MKRTDNVFGSRSRGAVTVLMALFTGIVALSLVMMIHSLADSSHSRSQLKLKNVQARYLSRAAVKAGRDSIQASHQAGVAPPTSGTVASVPDKRSRQTATY